MAFVEPRRRFSPTQITLGSGGISPRDFKSYVSRPSGGYSAGSSGGSGSELQDLLNKIKNAMPEPAYPGAFSGTEGNAKAQVQDLYGSNTMGTAGMQQYDEPWWIAPVKGVASIAGTANAPGAAIRSNWKLAAEQDAQAIANIAPWMPEHLRNAVGLALEANPMGGMQLGDVLTKAGGVQHATGSQQWDNAKQAFKDSMSAKDFESTGDEGNILDMIGWHPQANTHTGAWWTEKGGGWEGFAEDLIRAPRGVASLAGDIFTDPVSYLSLAAGGAAKGAEQTLAKGMIEASAEKIAAKEAAVQTGRQIMSEVPEHLGSVVTQATNAAQKAAAEAGEQAVKLGVKETAETAGQKAFNEVYESAAEDFAQKAIDAQFARVANATVTTADTTWRDAFVKAFGSDFIDEAATRAPKAYEAVRGMLDAPMNALDKNMSKTMAKFAQQGQKDFSRLALEIPFIASSRVNLPGGRALAKLIPIHPVQSTMGALANKGLAPTLSKFQQEYVKTGSALGARISIAAEKMAAGAENYGRYAMGRTAEAASNAMKEEAAALSKPGLRRFVPGYSNKQMNRMAMFVGAMKEEAKVAGVKPEAFTLKDMLDDTYRVVATTLDGHNVYSFEGTDAVFKNFDEATTAAEQYKADMLSRLATNNDPAVAQAASSEVEASVAAENAREAARQSVGAGKTASTAPVGNVAQEASGEVTGTSAKPTGKAAKTFEVNGSKYEIHKTKVLVKTNKNPEGSMKTAYQVFDEDGKKIGGDFTSVKRAEEKATNHINNRIKAAASTSDTAATGGAATPTSQYRRVSPTPEDLDAETDTVLRLQQRMVDIKRQIEQNPEMADELTKVYDELDAARATMQKENLRKRWNTRGSTVTKKQLVREDVDISGVKPLNAKQGNRPSRVITVTHKTTGESTDIKFIADRYNRLRMEVGGKTVVDSKGKALDFAGKTEPEMREAAFNEYRKAFRKQVGTDVPFVMSNNAGIKQADEATYYFKPTKASKRMSRLAREEETLSGLERTARRGVGASGDNIVLRKAGKSNLQIAVAHPNMETGTTEYIPLSINIPGVTDRTGKVLGRSKNINDTLEIVNDNFDEIYDAIAHGDLPELTKAEQLQFRMAHQLTPSRAKDATVETSALELIPRQTIGSGKTAQPIRIFEPSERYADTGLEVTLNPGRVDEFSADTGRITARLRDTSQNVYTVLPGNKAVKENIDLLNPQLQEEKLKAIIGDENYGIIRQTVLGPEEDLGGPELITGSILHGEGRKPSEIEELLGKVIDRDAEDVAYGPLLEENAKPLLWKEDVASNKMLELLDKMATAKKLGKKADPADFDALSELMSKTAGRKVKRYEVNNQIREFMANMPETDVAKLEERTVALLEKITDAKISGGKVSVKEEEEFNKLMRLLDFNRTEKVAKVIGREKKMGADTRFMAKVSTSDAGRTAVISDDYTMVFYPITKADGTTQFYVKPIISFSDTPGVENNLVTGKKGIWITGQEYFDADTTNGAQTILQRFAEEVHPKELKKTKLMAYFDEGPNLSSVQTKDESKAVYAAKSGYLRDADMTESELAERFARPKSAPEPFSLPELGTATAPKEITPEMRSERVLQNMEGIAQGDASYMDDSLPEWQKYYRNTLEEPNPKYLRPWYEFSERNLKRGGIPGPQYGTPLSEDPAYYAGRYKYGAYKPGEQFPSVEAWKSGKIVEPVKDISQPLPQGVNAAQVDGVSERNVQVAQSIEAGAGKAEAAKIAHPAPEGTPNLGPFNEVIGPTPPAGDVPPSSGGGAGIGGIGGGGAGIPPTGGTPIPPTGANNPGGVYQLMHKVQNLKPITDYTGAQYVPEWIPESGAVRVTRISPEGGSEVFGVFETPELAIDYVNAATYKAEVPAMMTEVAPHVDYDRLDDLIDEYVKKTDWFSEDDVPHLKAVARKMIDFEDEIYAQLSADEAAGGINYLRYESGYTPGYQVTRDLTPDEKSLYELLGVRNADDMTAASSQWNKAGNRVSPRSAEMGADFPDYISQLRAESPYYTKDKNFMRLTTRAQRTGQPFEMNPAVRAGNRVRVSAEDIGAEKVRMTLASAFGGKPVEYIGKDSKGIDMFLLNGKRVPASTIAGNEQFVVSMSNDVAYALPSKFSNSMINGIITDIYDKPSLMREIMGKYFMPLMTIANPRHVITNTLGNVDFALRNGRLDPASLVEGFNVAKAMAKGSTEGLNLTVLGEVVDDPEAFLGDMVRNEILWRQSVDPMLAESTQLYGTHLKGLMGNRVLAPYFQAARTINTLSENTFRAGVYFNALRGGMTKEAAIAEANRVMLDYAQEGLTQAERNLRGYIPFYMWMRRNIPATTEFVFERPGLAAEMYGVGPVDLSMSQDQNGNTRQMTPSEYSERWRELTPSLRDNAGTPIFGPDYFITPRIPIDDVMPWVNGGTQILDTLTGNKERPIDQGIDTIKKQMIQSTSPFIKMGYEALGGTDLETGQPIAFGGNENASELEKVGAAVAKNLPDIGQILNAFDSEKNFTNSGGERGDPNAVGRTLSGLLSSQLARPRDTNTWDRQWTFQNVRDLQAKAAKYEGENKTMVPMNKTDYMQYVYSGIPRAMASKNPQEAQIGNAINAEITLMNLTKQEPTDQQIIDWVNALWGNTDGGRLVDKIPQYPRGDVRYENSIPQAQKNAVYNTFWGVQTPDAQIEQQAKAYQELVRQNSTAAKLRRMGVQY